MEDSDESEFEDTNYESSQSPTLPSFELKTPQSCQTIALSMWLIGFILRLQAKYYVPEAALDGLIKFLYVFLSLLARLAPSLKPLLEVFPHSLYDTISFTVMTHSVRLLCVRNVICFIVSRPHLIVWDHKSTVKSVHISGTLIILSFQDEHLAMHFF